MYTYIFYVCVCVCVCITLTDTHTPKRWSLSPAAALSYPLRSERLQWRPLDYLVKTVVKTDSNKELVKVLHYYCSKELVKVNFTTTSVATTWLPSKDCVKTVVKTLVKTWLPSKDSRKELPFLVLYYCLCLVLYYCLCLVLYYSSNELPLLVLYYCFGLVLYNCLYWDGFSGWSLVLYYCL